MWLLQNSESESERLTFRLTPGAVKTIGRVAGVDFIVDAALVSRVHCRLEAADDVMTVVDLQSTNGTYVNDDRVERGAVKAGDRLRVGRMEFMISRSLPPEP